MTQKLLVLVIAAFLNVTYLDMINIFSSSESDIYLYGKVTTDDGEEYTGQIRWGKEEAFWFDFFNSTKPENKNLDYLSDEDLKKVRTRKNGEDFVKGLFGWDSNSNTNTHLFACQFGNLKSIEMGRKSRVTLTFKNGETMQLKGGSNDIETYIQVTDPNLGHIKLDWDRLERVDFMKANGSLDSYYGKPLYGTVKTESGDSFTGYVQWDHDERLANDELNGRNKDGELDLKFGNISKIEKESRSSSLVTTKSGRSFVLKGSNDVNNQNRGIIVNIAELGRVDIPWKEFESVEFSEAKTGIIDYDNFDGHKNIQGTVTTNNGQKHNGRLIYDLDESLQLEILHGTKDDIEYFIPFSIIRSIAPSGDHQSKVSLSSGQSLVLEDSVDVSEDNDGVLVFKSDNDRPVYIPWEDISKIDF